MDAAAAAGALYVFAVHDDWNTRGDPALSAYRGVPLVDAAAFLRHVEAAKLTPDCLEEGQVEVGFKLPHLMGAVEALVLAVDL